jgi:NADPH-dependent glutamate synthase beta subunit-like oxidoreductase/ferredoxin
MPRVTIDKQSVEVPEGASILDAARKLGMDIPTLCHLPGREPAASCMVCMVKVLNPPRLVPACASKVADGMEIESETEEVRGSRRMALELLLSDHAGDCYAPCQSICPAHMEIPLMVRQIAAGKLGEAVAVAKNHIALPAIIGRIRTKPCEKGCRRLQGGGSVSVCLLKQHVADEDLHRGEPYMPRRKPSRGKKVAIVGAGPTGLAAAYYLLQEGLEVTVFDDHELPGGMMRYAITEDRLPRAVLDGEIALVEKLGARFRMGARVGREIRLSDLRGNFDAVLLAAGELDASGVEALGVAGSAQGITAAKGTFATNLEGVFAAGAAVRKSRLAVRSVAEGRSAAYAISQSLEGKKITGVQEPFNHRLLQIAPVEIQALAAAASPGPRLSPVLGAVSGFKPEEAAREAARCLGCDCRKVGDCKLRLYAEEYGADWSRFRGARRKIEIHVQQGGVIFEPGKCISCGICVQIAEEAGEPLGLTFVGRGFDVRIGVPFGRTIEEGLRKVAAECVAACPTGALAFEERSVVPCSGWCASP